MNYSTLQIFNYPAYNLIDSKKIRNKLESKSKRYYFIDFTKGTKKYMLGIQKRIVPLLGEIWSSNKIQCCKQNKKRRTKRKMKLHQIIREMSLSF